jgi:serine/threonine protein kinase
MVPVEIFMGLKEGTLHDLVDNRIKFPVELVLPQMLKALDFVASKGIVHRDLKPSNILYVSPNGQYTFQLGDFGLCNDTTATSTGIGTNIYMAPEINVAGVCQTKADVWSLFVTMLWVSDPNFRERSHDLNPAELQQTILDAAQEMGGVVSTMAIKDPEQRASAAYILLSMYDGDGLTTPRHRIRHANIPAAKATTETSSAWPPSRPTPYFT